jgi:hypothetical protein
MTSDERHEVAKRLRENASKHGVTLDYLGSTQVASWWLLLHTIGCESNEQESAFRMLADLIDPTCRVESVEPIEYGEFNVFKLTCGHGVMRPREDMPPAYCDECGARVVSDDD